jgi:hypothetical protein
MYNNYQLDVLKLLAGRKIQPLIEYNIVYKQNISERV